MKKKILKVPKHERSQMIEGVPYKNIKEICKCDDCVMLRKRRDSIYKNQFFINKLKIWNM